MPFSDFQFDFLLIFKDFSYQKSRKRGFLFHRPCRADVAWTLTWRAQLTWHAGPARMQRGTEATWQGCAWPTRGAGGADTWQEATRVHANAREGRHMAEWGLACEGPTG